MNTFTEYIVKTGFFAWTAGFVALLLIIIFFSYIKNFFIFLLMKLYEIFIEHND